MKLFDREIESVYSGINGRCCCGCSGKHSESARSIKIITGKIAKALAAPGQDDGNYAIEYNDPEFVSAVSPTGRLIVAYFKKEPKPVPPPINEDR